MLFCLMVVTSFIYSCNGYLLSSRGCPQNSSPALGLWEHVHMWLLAAGVLCERVWEQILGCWDSDLLQEADPEFSWERCKGAR